MELTKMNKLVLGIMVLAYPVGNNDELTKTEMHRSVREINEMLRPTFGDIAIWWLPFRLPLNSFFFIAPLFGTLNLLILFAPALY